MVQKKEFLNLRTCKMKAETNHCDNEEINNFDQNTMEIEFIKKLGSIDVYKYFTFAKENEIANQKIYSLRENNQILQQSLNKIKQSYEMKTKEYLKLSAVYNELYKDYTKVRSVYNQLVNETQVLKINAGNLNTLNKEEVEPLKSEKIQLPSKKETCEQGNKKNQGINNLNEEVESSKSETIQLQNKKEALEQDNKKSQEIINNMNEEVESLKTETIQLQNKEEIWEQGNKKNQEIIKNLNEEVESWKTETIQLQNVKVTWEQDNKKNQAIINNLNEKSESLQSEVIQYQSTRNVRWDDTDLNNSANLTKDIRKLQDSLCDFIFLKGKAYVVKKYNIQQLFKILKTRANINHKPSVSAALQQLVIKKIIRFYDEHMLQDRSRTYSTDNNTLEKRLVSCADNLTNMVKEFTNTREGNDNITGITEIKVRQEIYTMLGYRGFGYKGCRFILDLKRRLLKTLDNYRSINDSDSTISKEQDRAEEIVLGVIRILNFRLLTQEPVATIRWFENGEPLNETLMEWVSTDEDETNMVVDICAFPAIGVYLDDPTKRQIYTKAKVEICNMSNKISNASQEGIMRILKAYTNYNSLSL
ncbi:7690_t:CDS:2 [Ambispora gerdemannii]|uniref:7690_t:CDS:1 n=1 Tax=Ambispora gerdemannii TaxID=144530 RepID=A0A9N9DY81_9GLOM|nr:7690_t:CDS:2 [Ambispora gerdemannii]